MCVGIRDVASEPDAAGRVRERRQRNKGTPVGLDVVQRVEAPLLRRAADRDGIRERKIPVEKQSLSHLPPPPEFFRG